MHHHLPPLPAAERRPSWRAAGLAVSAAVAGVTAVAAPVAAHVEESAAGGLGPGLLHPITGTDHLVAMLAVGLLATLVGRRGAWAIPAGFLGGMVVGGATGLIGGEQRLVELGIAWSVVLLGLLVVATLATIGGRGRAALVAVVALFGTFHGYAHGAELPGGSGGVSYAIGILMATTGLLLAGTVLGVGVRRAPAARLAAGSLVSALGVAVLLGA